MLGSISLSRVVVKDGSDGAGEGEREDGGDGCSVVFVAEKKGVEVLAG